MQDQRICYTVHSFRHQGIAGEDVLWASGLGRPEYFFDPLRMRDDFNVGALNLMKGAILYSNFVTTVSPHHAWEARNLDQGFGVDYDVWNPEVDRCIPYRYRACISSAMPCTACSAAARSSCFSDPARKAASSGRSGA